jgi:hypothetical protein
VPRLLATTLPTLARKFLHLLDFWCSHPSHRLADPPPQPSQSTLMGGDSPGGCDQTPSTPVTAARASSAPRAHPCPAELTMAKIEELDSTGSLTRAPKDARACGASVGRVVASRRGTHAPKPEAMLMSPVNGGPRGVGTQRRVWRHREPADKTQCLQGFEHVLCCKNDRELLRKVSLR